MRDIKVICSALLGFACFASAASAGERLARIFGDNMVLQREKPVPIWGWADKGQSNMEMELLASQDFQAERVKATYPAIRHLKVMNESASFPADDLPRGDWKFARPDRYEIDPFIPNDKPGGDWTVYGMNDGIYASASEERAKAYYDGMLNVVKDSQAQGVEKVILLTPPVFDPRPWSTCLSKEGDAPLMNHPYEKYDEVLAGYSNWIMGLRLDGVSCIDLHTPMKKEIAGRCQKKPEFKLFPDGIHPGPLGHLVMALAGGYKTCPSTAYEQQNITLIFDMIAFFV